MTSAIEMIVLLEIFKEIRKEMRDHRALLLEIVDRGHTLERKVDTQMLVIARRLDELKEEIGGEIREDLELTLRSELMGIVSDLEIGGSRG